MILLDMFRFKPCKSKSYAYVMCGITSVLFLIYAVLANLHGYYFGCIAQSMLTAALFAAVGICVHDDNKGGVLGAITLLMGYFMSVFVQNGFTFIGEFFDDVTVADKVWDVSMFIASIAFAVGVIAYLLGKYIGYKRDVMSAIGVRVNIIAFLALIVLSVAYLFLSYAVAADFVYYLACAFVPIACLSSAGLAEHLNHNKHEI